MPFLDPMFGAVGLSDLPPERREEADERLAILEAAGDPDPLDRALAITLYRMGRDHPAEIPTLEARYGVSWPELLGAFATPSG